MSHYGDASGGYGDTKFDEQSLNYGPSGGTRDTKFDEQSLKYGPFGGYGTYGNSGSHYGEYSDSMEMK